ncbi:MAG: hypothetical protein BYD32DRAFT_433018 [Podila humilis]|nr:MAG: hypothetical protein BYD32DRAFT_433018 [Podila humilis]
MVAIGFGEVKPVSFREKVPCGGWQRSAGNMAHFCTLTVPLGPLHSARLYILSWQMGLSLQTASQPKSDNFSLDVSMITSEGVQMMRRGQAKSNKSPQRVLPPLYMFLPQKPKKLRTIGVLGNPMQSVVSRRQECRDGGNDAGGVGEGENDGDGDNDHDEDRN